MEEETNREKYLAWRRPVGAADDDSDDEESAPPDIQERRRKTRKRRREPDLTARVQSSEENEVENVARSVKPAMRHKCVGTEPTASHEDESNSAVNDDDHAVKALIEAVHTRNLDFAMTLLTKMASTPLDTNISPS